MFVTSVAGHHFSLTIRSLSVHKSLTEQKLLNEGFVFVSDAAVVGNIVTAKFVCMVSGAPSLLAHSMVEGMWREVGNVEVS